mmetsp:Transcript_48927/g.140451  ORF Transcript_48927/g.140451 Transcript_48927/m.140451 type:complete len:211 (+) Transcript_48927:281-913(+)
MVVRAIPSPPQHIVMQVPALCTSMVRPFVKATREAGSMRCVSLFRFCLMMVPPAFKKTLPSPSSFWKKSPAPQQHCLQSVRATSMRVPLAPKRKLPFMVKSMFSGMVLRSMATMCPGRGEAKPIWRTESELFVQCATDAPSPEHVRRQHVLHLVQQPGSLTEEPSSKMVSMPMPFWLKDMAPGSLIMHCCGGSATSMRGMESPVVVWLPI